MNKIIRIEFFARHFDGIEKLKYRKKIAPFALTSTQLLHLIHKFYIITYLHTYIIHTYVRSRVIRCYYHYRSFYQMVQIILRDQKIPSSFSNRSIIDREDEEGKESRKKKKRIKIKIKIKGKSYKMIQVSHITRSISDESKDYFK